jgi:hypothetical protein
MQRKSQRGLDRRLPGLILTKPTGTSSPGLIPPSSQHVQNVFLLIHLATYTNGTSIVQKIFRSYLSDLETNLKTQLDEIQQLERVNNFTDAKA